jgi:hypothetical protein
VIGVHEAAVERLSAEQAVQRLPRRAHHDFVLASERGREASGAARVRFENR